MRTQRLIVYVFAACLVSLFAGTAMADDERGHFNAFLKGTYRISATLSCSSGPNPESIGSDPTSFITFAGVITYDGHGRATATDHGVNIGTGSPDGFDEACEFSYKVARDGSFSQTGSCTDAGKSFLLSGLKWNGQIGDEGEVLITNRVGTDVEKLEVPAPPALAVFTRYSICGGVGTAVRIHPH
jgi:hypothetical protein